MRVRTAGELSGTVQMDSERQEELPPRQVPQLETRPQCGPDNVRYAQDRKDGTLHDGPRGDLYELLFHSKMTQTQNVAHVRNIVTGNTDPKVGKICQVFESRCRKAKGYR